MKVIVFASCLVLGTLVAGTPVAERRHTTPKFTSIVVFGDSFSDNVRFPS
jgi:phospholipase/lecithinase/hemolysin